ncbi:Cd2+/Zn2+-exporting ATPase [Melghirimyces thermohalophilus]|uniref:Cd(2+)-exporting ATPase n=1 Tax=Melghirimyces thermohalophilus TaxID=1236220 RepID=A0A1G6L2L0_9BACL|nr:Cd2+/Zn2+-exporting ATPase [Melghirimyces thermohalophilus]
MADARLNFGASKVTIVGKKLSTEKINRLGAFDDIQVAEGEPDEGASFWTRNRQVRMTALSLVFLLLAFLLQWLQVSKPPVIGLFLLATVIGGWETARKGFPSLIQLQFDMNSLMSVAVSGALAIGYWEEAAVVAFLFGVSESLQAYTTSKARRSLKSLVEWAPREATVRREGQLKVLPVEEIAIGDMMLVKPGEKLAMDGVVTAGRSAVNQAAITGESVPVPVGPQDEVYAGSINEEGALDVRVTKRVEDTTLARIIDLVEEAQEQRAPSQAFVDRFAKYYTPAIMILAAGLAWVPPLFFGSPWISSIYDALALLIVACPCALVVSTPVAIVSAIGNAAQNGVLIKGGLHLENMGALRVMAFDKTGTLTRGEPRVTRVIPVHGVEKAEALALAATLEARSEHPLARAILQKAKEKAIPIGEAHDFEAIPGRGARGVVDGRECWIGSPRLFEENHTPLQAVQPLLEELQSQGETAVLLGDGKQITAIFALADTLRDISPQAIAELRRAGVKRSVMLTGDHRATAQAIATQAGIQEYRADLLPEDKVEAVKELRESDHRIGMVGDGINDAPAMAVATTGIAMGGAGTDTALETADVVLMADDLSKLPFTVRLSRAALRVIKQNIGFSLLTKFAAVYLVFPGWLTLWLAIFADMGAAVLVTLNSLRLIRIRP